MVITKIICHVRAKRYSGAGWRNYGGFACGDRLTVAVTSELGGYSWCVLNSRLEVAHMPVFSCQSERQAAAAWRAFTKTESFARKYDIEKKKG